MNETRLIQPRFFDTGKETLSNLVVVEGKCVLFTCVGLELPWKDNQRRISCIPVGVYDCIKVPATAAIPYEHISILGVPNRDGICIHKANYVSQLLGCVAVGEKHVDLNNDSESDVTNSDKTYKTLMALLPDKFKLEIK